MKKLIALISLLAVAAFVSIPIAIHDMHKVSAQTAPYTCTAGQFVNSQLINTGQTCGTPAAPVTFVANCTVTQTAVVSISAGPRTVASTCTGVVSGASYLLVESAASLAANPGYGIFAGAVASAANTLQVTLYAPLLAIGGSYNITYAVYRLQ